MRSLSLGFAAALIVSAAPASAQTFGGAGFTSAGAFATTGSGGTTEGIRNATSSGSGVTVHRDYSGDRGRDGGNHQRRNRDRGFGGSYYSDLRDGYDINRGWASDSYNDWWHDRPDRAYPAWMSRNRNCERKYWSGGDWRC